MIQELKKFWFENSHMWFANSETYDLLIKNKFEYLLHETNPNTDLLSLIILYDQISRHVFRNDKDKIKFYDNIALKYSLQLLPDINLYNPEERCFILLPLRHTFDEKMIELVLDYIKKWINETDIPIYRRFYQATIKSLSIIKTNKDTLKNQSNYNFETFNIIYDPKSSKLNNNNNINFDCIIKSKLYIEFQQNIPINNKQLVVSISGGVDSMVASLLLYVYSQINHIKPIAICINYKNREEQDIEVDMIFKWLDKLNIEFHVREISEIQRQRNSKDRDFYEKITRKIRFDMYKKIGGSVIIGHNKDDSLENIFSNIIKSNSYDNLLGMDITSQEQDVTILRPLLNISKNEIINFAHEFNVPYVYDSTPKWSDRGKMRDILIPQIQNFNNDILDGLIKLSHNFKEIYKIYKSFIPNIIFKIDYCYFETNDENCFFDYWKNIVQIICKHYSISMIRNKSINNMIKTLYNNNKITLSKNISCTKKNNQIIFYIKFD